MSEDAKAISQIAATLAGKSQDSAAFRDGMKRILVKAWQSLDWDERASFMARVDENLDLDLAPISIQAYLNAWDLVTQQPLEGWEAEFAKSVAARRRKGWVPSEKEAKHIRRMYLDALQAQQADQQEDVIE